MPNPEKQKSRILPIVLLLASLFFINACTTTIAKPGTEAQLTTLVHACIDESYDPAAPTICAPNAHIISNLPIRATLATGEITTITNSTPFYYPEVKSWAIDPTQVRKVTKCSTYYIDPITTEGSPDELIEYQVVLADCDN